MKWKAYWYGSMPHPKGDFAGFVVFVALLFLHWPVLMAGGVYALGYMALYGKEAVHAKIRSWDKPK